MKIFLLLIIISFCLSCGKKDDTPAPPTDTIDMYTGMTYSRFGFKSPVNGKDVYYYLTFKKNFQIDSYIKYNKTEATSDNAETATYQYVQRNPATTTNTTSFLLTFKSGVIPADLTGGKFILHNSSGDLTYNLEP